MTFSEDYRKALAGVWAPTETCTVSEWADRYRVLSPAVTSEPGPWRTDRVPYMREIMDAFGDSKHREVAVVKPSQVAGSEGIRNAIGRWVATDPGPMLILYPTQKSAQETITKRVLPMFEDTPALRGHLTGRAWDLKSECIKLDNCEIAVAWAGSRQSLASDPRRYAIADETDNYVGYRGDISDPLSLLRARLRTYQHRSKLISISTPTIPTGPIMRAFGGSAVRKEQHVPCPACGARSLLAWEHLFWDRMNIDDADSLQAMLAAFECGSEEVRYRFPCCARVVEDAERWSVIREASWELCAGSAEDGTTIGFIISGLCSPWTPWRDLARCNLAARLKGVSEVHYFYNNQLGLPFWGVNSGQQGQEASISAAVIAEKSARGGVRGLLPEWAMSLVASADTGKDHFHWGVRAWGAGWKSTLIDYGIARSFEDLYTHTLGARFGSASPCTLWIDSGGTSTRTEEVYRFARTDPRIMPLKGYGGVTKPLKPVVTYQHAYRPPGDGPAIEVLLSIVDVQYFKDLLASRINSDDHDLWMLPVGVDHDYAVQMSAERRILVEQRVKENSVLEVWRWVPRSNGAANHFWDMEVYNCVGAFALDAVEQAPLARSAPVQQRAPRRAVDAWGRPYHVGRR